MALTGHVDGYNPLGGARFETGGARRGRDRVEDGEREQELVDLPQEGFRGYNQVAAGSAGNNYGLVVSQRRRKEEKSNVNR